MQYVMLCRALLCIYSVQLSTVNNANWFVMTGINKHYVTKYKAFVFKV